MKDYNYFYNTKEYGWTVSEKGKKDKHFDTKIEVVDYCVDAVIDNIANLEVTAPSERVYLIYAEDYKNFWNGKYGEEGLRNRIRKVFYLEDN